MCVLINIYRYTSCHVTAKILEFETQNSAVRFMKIAMTDAYEGPRLHLQPTHVMRLRLNFIPVDWKFCPGLEHSAWDLEICRLTNLRLPACWPRLWNNTPSIHPPLPLATTGQTTVHLSWTVPEKRWETESCLFSDQPRFWKQLGRVVGKERCHVGDYKEGNIKKLL